MKTKELIEALSKLDPEKDIKCFDILWGENEIDKVAYVGDDDANVIFMKD